MAKKLSGWKTKGMNRDLSVSAYNPEFAFENMNLRLSTNDGNTLMSWVNERGTESVTISSESGLETSMLGTPVGTAVINHQLIVFTVEEPEERESVSRIYKLYDFKGSTCKGELLYTDPEDEDSEETTKAPRLDLHVLYPLETLVSYEGEEIQKVYWTDGKNQPRVINIANSYIDKPANIFNFVPDIDMEGTTVHVEKLLGGSGTFTSGVIQYAFTYYYKYGQESNVFHVTPLYYISHNDRGAAPDEKVDNAFRITINAVDDSFDYLRIYSIHRTSINGTPVCKRIQDISLKHLKDAQEKTVSYTDTNNSGDNIDPTELFYKGGIPISAKTMEQKDGTLFLGNIKELGRGIADIRDSLKDFAPTSCYRQIKPLVSSTKGYKYASQLTAVEVVNNVPTTHVVPCCGFKKGQTYRLGIQLQYKDGRWSEPIHMGDVVQDKSPEENNGTIRLPQFSLEFNESGLVKELHKAGFRRMRGVMVMPEIQDREILCQGITCPAIYNKDKKYYQSSWFFRDKLSDDEISPYTQTDGTASPHHRSLGYLDKDTITGDIYNYSRLVEIGGIFDDKNQLNISKDFLTFHSPDIEFDSNLYHVDYSTVNLYSTSEQVHFDHTLSDIDIQTETPTISSFGSGFVHKSFSKNGSFGIVSGLFYDDVIVEDHDSESQGTSIFRPLKVEKSSVKWLVYPWQASGSLNNDITRPADKGVSSAKLRKKIISNLRYSNAFNIPTDMDSVTLQSHPKLFFGDDPTFVKVGNELYSGNVDTALVPDKRVPNYFFFDGDSIDSDYKGAAFNSNNLWKTDLGIYAVEGQSNESQEGAGIYHWKKSETEDKWEWVLQSDKDYRIGNQYLDLAARKGSVRMKYKSTAHLAFQVSGISNDNESWLGLHVAEIRKNVSNQYGGTTTDAFLENTWIPCGEPVALDDTCYFSWGDTYYQRWDCLKTYAFTEEDTNQIVEIGSFMVETYTNIDGRYDRNRGQLNNLYMSPRNFNLLNPVYSQTNNFFSYKMSDTLQEDSKTKRYYPNQVTWTLTKQSGAITDIWTQVSLASILELDGDRGNLNKLLRFNNQLIAFQDTGVSQILYNENTQISTTEGVPIEIANSGKVQGKRYLSNTIGCSNKWSIVSSPSGVYFMDSNDKTIYVFNGQFQNLSVANGFNSWCKKYISSVNTAWNPKDFGRDDVNVNYEGYSSLSWVRVDTFDDTFDYTFHPDEEGGGGGESESETRDGAPFGVFVGYYDKLNQEVLYINYFRALAFSERVGAFTSFYDYGNTPYFCQVDDVSIWIRNDASVWRHQASDNYCSFFNEQKPYWMTLIGNPEPQVDKTFTNLEFRAIVESDGDEGINNRFDFLLPFDSLEAWNEYQHGQTTLEYKYGHEAMMHHAGQSSALKRKFRIWRCDIPRDNVAIPSDEGEQAEFFAKENSLGIYRKSVHPLDRMRNPWIYLKLMKEAEGSMYKMEMHDLVMTYFG